MSVYNYNGKTIKSYLQGLYDSGLQHSRYLSDADVELLLHQIGIFKFKGYIYAFKSVMNGHSIDDILMIFFFDKYLSRLLMDLTSSIETRLKSTLIELCYKQINSLPGGHPQKNNPFFYLMTNSYKYRVNPHTGIVINPELKGTSVQNWKNGTSHTTVDSVYIHYGLYYKNKYDFPSNQTQYLNGQMLIHRYPDINYPPFHYFVESATLGTIIYLVKNLQIDSYDVLAKMARKFSISNPTIDFAPYLERLNEVRNRAAHRERLFNRSYRSVARVGHFHTLSIGMSDHKFMDVYLYLFFMLGQINNYRDQNTFIQDEIERLFRGFRSDYYLRKISKGLTKKMKRKEFERIKGIVLRAMQ
jgi:abortive infection bacteriophage resistance protein